MNALERQMKHREGLEYFYRGDLAVAIQIFSEAKDLYGEHVSLLADLSKAYCLQGDIEQAQKVRLLLEDEYLAAEPLLSEDSKVHTLIFLAQMRADSGDAQSALNALESAFEFCGANTDLNLLVLAEFAALGRAKV